MPNVHDVTPSSTANESMSISAGTFIKELEDIEADDALHDFGGAHGSKGHDFATFWLIFRLIDLERAKRPDYLFVCEYLQDVAEFDSAHQPAKLRLYQLKKKEDGYWNVNALTGQTGKAKSPKTDRPVWKLLGHVRTVKGTLATGAFVTNAKFDVPLASGHRSVNETRIGLHQLDAAHTAALSQAVAKSAGVKPSDVDLSLVELHSEPIAINDLQRHINGVMLEFLNEIAPDHAGQATSLVDTLYVRIKARSRRTEKCATWDELVERRGFGRSAFQAAVEGLRATPDKVSIRLSLFNTLSAGWRHVRRVQVEAALTRCAREKVMFGESSRWHIKDALRAVLAASDTEKWTDEACFEAACNHIVAIRPELSPDEISALAIYEMTEWALSQIPA